MKLRQKLNNLTDKTLLDRITVGEKVTLIQYSTKQVRKVRK